MRIVTESDIRRLVPLSLDVVAAVEDGFRALGAGSVVTPPILRLDLPESRGEMDVKTAHARGWDTFAVKMSTGFFDNPARGLPSGDGLMVLVSAQTGTPVALLLDGGYLTTVRTAEAGAVAALWLAPKRVDTVGLVGSGVQAWFQVRALLLVRRYRRVLVWSPTPDHARQLAERVIRDLHREAEPTPDLERLVRTSDLVVTATPSRVPLVEAKWLHAGQHITAMGADAPDKQELAEDVWGRADVRVCDVRTQALALGDSHHAVEAGILDPGRLLELGAVVAGRCPGRTASDQVTVCDLTGTGIQDTAVARLTYQRALAGEVGQELRPGERRTES